MNSGPRFIGNCHGPVRRLIPALVSQPKDVLVLSPVAVPIPIIADFLNRDTRLALGQPAD